MKLNQPWIFLGKVVLLTAQLLEGAKLHVSVGFYDQDSFQICCLTLRATKKVLCSHD